jgi:hypothetical protein
MLTFFISIKPPSFWRLGEFSSSGFFYLTQMRILSIDLGQENIKNHQEMCSPDIKARGSLLQAASVW